MKAIVQERFGPPDVLRPADTDPPEIGPDDVLVQVQAVALNPYDWHMLSLPASSRRITAAPAEGTATVPLRDQGR
ncbi:hypothetical protein [Actinoallomurus sp. NPDC052274]|uniref:hypothetical protein n=1 Tax=Actinoallomurus sp. NPDC052274 TaxID=3155420 RepID=UPI003437168D